MSSTKPASRLPLREMLAFGCGDFAAVLYWTMSTRFLPIFYTDVFGITAGALGDMLLVSRIWDGVNDPMVGVWADRTQSRWGKFRPFILWGCIPFAVTAVLCFTTPALGPLGKLIWAYTTYNLFMMLCTVVNIPYTSLMGVMTNDPAERTRLSSIKFTFAYGAAFLVSVGLLPLAERAGGAGNPQLGWQMVAVGVAVLATLFYLVTFLGTRERVKTAEERGATIRKDLGLLLRNKAWLIILGTTCTWVLSSSLRDSVSVHFLKYVVYNGSPDVPLHFLGFDLTLSQLSAAYFGIGTLMGIVGLVVIATTADRLSKKVLLITLYSLAVACNLCIWFLRPDQVGVLFIIQIMANLFGAPLPMLLWAMFADTADYGEWKSGRRTTGLVFSASSFSMKMGFALGGWIALRLLDYAGFVANQVPGEEVKSHLVNLMSIYPAVLAALSIGIFCFYPLTERRMRQIKADLDARHNPADLPAAGG